jgi:hypothetical protein
MGVTECPLQERLIGVLVKDVQQRPHLVAVVGTLPRAPRAGSPEARSRIPGWLMAVHEHSSHYLHAVIVPAMAAHPHVEPGARPLIGAGSRV